MRHGHALLCLTMAGSLTGCSLIPEPPPEQDCPERGTFYPDEDGNGIGEPSAIYIGCSAPEGWVDNVNFAGPDTDTADADSDVPDTDAADTDSDVPDTDAADTDSDVPDADTADTDSDVPDTDPDQG